MKVLYQSQLVGAFNGFTGQTLFELKNGQMWVQTNYDCWFSTAFRPDVTIYQQDGTTYLQIESNGCPPVPVSLVTNDKMSLAGYAPDSF